MIYKNNHQLAAWLTEDHKVSSVIGARHFYFKDEDFADALQHVQVAGKFTNEQGAVRAAHKLIMAGKFVADAPIFRRRPTAQWLDLAWKIIVILLLAVIAARAEPKPIYVKVGKTVLALLPDPAPQVGGGVVIQLQNGGSTLATRGGGLVTFNCSTNLSCSFSGTTFTLTATAGGMGCTLPGGVNLLLYDATGTCTDITKWSTNGTTTLTGIATAILDMSAAARLRLPQVAAPTTEGDAAFNTTSHLPVWGFNGASTATIPATLANVSHKWLNSYDQTTGAFTQTQPACTDLSDSAGGCTMSTTGAGDISGTLPSVTVVNGSHITNSSIPNTGLVNTGTTVNGQLCTLGSTCTIPLSAVNPETATYQVLAADFSNYKTITVASGTFTITLVASGAQPTAGQYIQVINYGSGVVTVARSGQNINGAAGNFTLSAGSATAPTSAFIQSDGTNYFAEIDEGTLGTVTSVATTAPLGGGTITATGTLTCTTCATTTNGGALSGTAPVAISAAGAISCGTCATTTNGGALSGTSPVTISAAGAIGCATCGVKLCSGTQALNTSAISSGSKSVVITISCTGITTSQMDFASDPSGVTGYAPSASGTLTVVKYMTANNLNIYVYNDTSASVTPGAMSVNYAGY